MNFFDKENIVNVRLRAFYKQLSEDSEIKSEGAFQISFLNIGDDNATLEDVDGNKWFLATGLPFELNAHILPGHPGITRDDIIKVTFEGVGENPLVQVRFDRFVKKGDDISYPGQ